VIDGKYIIGLTGGIGAGKSTVAEIFQENGFYVIDADIVSREVVNLGSVVLLKISEEFGDQILDETGQLDRVKMADIVFKNPEKRKVLENLLHPAIIESIWSKVRNSEAKKVIIAAPLLIESGININCDLVIVVTAPGEICLERAVKRDNLNRDRVEARIRAQMKDDDRRDYADFIIENDSSLKNLERIVNDLIARINEMIETKRD
jgi:dephospho-CoA kinase